MQLKTVFLDRDGTINVDDGYMFDPDTLRLLPRAAAAVGVLKSYGYKLAVISNQSAIARGYATVAQVDSTNQQLLKLLQEGDSAATIDSIHYSPDAPEAATDLRKPGIGLLRDLPWAYDKETSWMIGDKLLDLEFGLNAGLKPERCLLVRTGHGEREISKVTEHPLLRSRSPIFADLYDAVMYLLAP